jgi:hypothetical protein
MAAILPVIQKIRMRAPMYVGQRSISCLRAFLNGWEFAHEGKVEDASLMQDFQEWVARKCRVPEGQSWDRILLFDSQDEAAAFDKFFAWFDEFVAAQNKGRASRPGKSQPSAEESRKPA